MYLTNVTKLRSVETVVISFRRFPTYFVQTGNGRAPISRAQFEQMEREGARVIKEVK